MCTSVFLVICDCIILVWENNNNTPPADLWRSTTRGHRIVTLRSSTTTRWWRRHFSQYNGKQQHTYFINWLYWAWNFPGL